MQYLLPVMIGMYFIAVVLKLLVFENLINYIYPVSGRYRYFANI